MFLENYPQNLLLFCTYLSDLRLTHSSCAPYFAEVFMSSAGRQHTHKMSSEYDARSLDLGCAEPNGPLSNHFQDTEKGCSCVHVQIYPSASMENFYPLRRTPSHTDALNSAHCCAELAQDCAELGAQEIAP